MPRHGWRGAQEVCAGRSAAGRLGPCVRETPEARSRASAWWSWAAASPPPSPHTSSAAIGAEVVRVEGDGAGPPLTADDETATWPPASAASTPTGSTAGRLVLVGRHPRRGGPPGRLSKPRPGTGRTAGRQALDGHHVDLAVRPDRPLPQLQGHEHRQLRHGRLHVADRRVRSGAVGVGWQPGAVLRWPPRFRRRGHRLPRSACSTARATGSTCRSRRCAAGTLELYGAGHRLGGPGHAPHGQPDPRRVGHLPCVDGYVGIFTLQRQVPNLFKAMGDPELIDGPFARPDLPAGAPRGAGGQALPVHAAAHDGRDDGHRPHAARCRSAWPHPDRPARSRPAWPSATSGTRSRRRRHGHGAGPAVLRVSAGGHLERLHEPGEDTEHGRRRSGWRAAA